MFGCRVTVKRPLEYCLIILYYDVIQCVNNEPGDLEK